ncbi:MAG: hypothetical protein HRT46_11720 [Deltaproteobacteria bacterium]|jgi:hypothetical protein|nr:hypothetical protein [Deltaproteobacteria bacterium]
MGIKMGLFGPMKTLDSARHGIDRSDDGRLRAWIDHEPMKGVTPAMLRWWFENIDTFSKWNGNDFDGPEVPVYRFWHPYDHIAANWRKRVLDAQGRTGVGSVIEIQENIGGRFEVRDCARVTRFDDEQFNFELLGGGFLPAATVDHIYAPVEGGCSFYTSVTVGNDWPLLGGLVARLAEKMLVSEEMLRAWILHNVEESGETEKFVPRLYAHAQGD